KPCLLREMSLLRYLKWLTDSKNKTVYRPALIHGFLHMFGAQAANGQYFGDKLRERQNGHCSHWLCRWLGSRLYLAPRQFELIVGFLPILTYTKNTPLRATRLHLVGTRWCVVFPSSAWRVPVKTSYTVNDNCKERDFRLVHSL